jgi:hypothetical protein
MKEAEYTEAVNRPGARQKFRYVKVDSPAAAHKGTVTLTREVEFVGRTGVDYARLAVNAEREIQARKWGVRRNRYFVDHTPKSGPNKGVPTVYATCFAVPGTFRTTYRVNGEIVSREAYNSYRTASAAKGSELDESGYMDIVLADLEALPSAAKVAAAAAAAA